MFEICVGALLTQNTAWANAKAAVMALNRAKAMSPEAIACLSAAKLRALIRPSGYYRQKAARLKFFARYVRRHHPAGFKKWFTGSSADQLRSELLKIKGIGPETADSMVLYAAAKAKFVIDAYTRRVFFRLDSIAGNYDELQDLFESALGPDMRTYNEYHALLVELGKRYCKKSRPLCGDCPLRRLCGRNI